MAVIDVKLVSGYQVEEESLDRVSIPVIGDLCYANGIARGQTLQLGMNKCVA